MALHAAWEGANHQPVRFSTISCVIALLEIVLDWIKARVCRILKLPTNKIIMNESFHELTDSQWQVMAKIINDQRVRSHSLRNIIDTILWLNYTGLQWRELNKRINTPPWQTVYYYFRQFKKRGVWPGRRCGATARQLGRH